MIGNNSLDSHASTSLTVGIITRLLLILMLSGMLSIVFSGVLSIVISCRVSALMSSLTHHTSTYQRVMIGKNSLDSVGSSSRRTVSVGITRLQI